MRKWLASGVAIVAAPLLMSAPAVRAASTESVLHAFTGADGDGPSGGLVQDAAGNLYGMTGRGGTIDASCPKVPPVDGSVVPDGCGLVFKLTPPAPGKTAWTETTLFRFSGSDGNSPSGELIFDKAGNPYGTASTGGNGAAACPGKATAGSFAGCGLVFELSPPAPGKPGWTETVLHNFTDADGALPSGSLALDSAGHLYGVTSNGGGTNAACPIDRKTGAPAGCGVAFELVPPKAGHTAWTMTVLHKFGVGSDGVAPLSKLIRDSAGNLYGTTTGGGLKPASCAADPSSGIIGGCGIVFKLNAPAAGKTGWTETILHRFTGGAGGSSPVGPVAFDRAGNLYGTTYLGGTSPYGALGTVFKLTRPANVATPWPLTVLHNFGTGGGANLDGAYPYAGLLVTPTDYLVGTTSNGGNQQLGTVFKLSPPAAGKTAWSETVLYAFSAGAQPNGYVPYGGVIRDAAGNLYGTTLASAVLKNGAGVAGDGTVFKIAP
jgi:hypothetical protein